MSIGNKSKSDLNLFCQKAHIPTALYSSSLVDGNFVSTVSVKDCEYHSTSDYPTKKEAENDAAGVALITILQTEFGGRRFEDVVVELEQKFPSKNKKKSKQTATVSEPPPLQVEHSRLQENSSSVSSTQPGSTLMTQQTTIAQGPQQPVVNPHVANAMLKGQVMNQNQTHPHQQHPAAVRPTPAHASTVPQHQVSPIQQPMVRPHTQQNQMMLQQQQPAVVRPGQPVYVASYAQSQSVQQQVTLQGTASPWNQGSPNVGAPLHHVCPAVGSSVHPHSRGPEQMQRTVGQPAMIHSQHHPGPPTPPSQVQPGPRQVYAPPVGMSPRAQIQSNTAGYVRANYQAPPHGVHPPPHGVHPLPRGVHSPGSTAGGGAVAAQMTPPPGMRPIAARFPGATPPAPGSSFPPPPAVARPQMPPPGKPLHAIPVSSSGEHRLPSSSSIGSSRQDSLPNQSTSNAASNSEIDHARNLEGFCRSRNLPAPKYIIKEEMEKFSARVEIGSKVYSTQWSCNSFEQAKITAAMSALSSLAISVGDLSITGTGIDWCRYHTATYRRAYPFNDCDCDSMYMLYMCKICLLYTSDAADE